MTALRRIAGHATRLEPVLRVAVLLPLYVATAVLAACQVARHGYTAANAVPLGILALLSGVCGVGLLQLVWEAGLPSARVCLLLAPLLVGITVSAAMAVLLWLGPAAAG